MISAVRVLAAGFVLSGLVVAAQGQEVFTPGNGVSPPTVVTEVKPEYTPEARDARIQGTVLLSVVIGTDGNVGDVAVEKSLDSVLGLDRQAVSAARQWTFKPGTKDGKPVAVRVHIEMAFTLK